MARVVGFEPTIMVLETIALGQAKLHRHNSIIENYISSLLEEQRRSQKIALM